MKVSTTAFQPASPLKSCALGLLLALAWPTFGPLPHAAITLQNAPAAPEAVTAPAEPAAPASGDAPAVPVVPAVPETPVEPEASSAEHARRGHRSHHFHGQSSRTEVGHDLTVGKGQSYDDVQVIGGDLTMDGEIMGDLIVVGGEVTLNGTVHGDMIIVAGSLKAGPAAKVREDTVLVLSSRTLDPAAQFLGEFRNIGWGALETPDINTWFRKGALMARPIAPSVAGSWVVMIILTALLGLVAAIFRKSTLAATAALEEKPVSACLVGLLTLALFPVVVTILAGIVVGIPIIPVLVLGMIGGALIGKAALYILIGRGICRIFSGTFTVGNRLAFILGSILILGSYTIPVISILVWLAAGTVGLGASVMAMAASRKRSPRPATTPYIPNNPTPPSSGPSDPGAGSTSPFGGAAPEAAFTVPPTLTSNPMGVVLLARAGFGKRLVALLLDLALMGLIFGGMHLPPAMFLPVLFLYHVGMLTWRGATIGKMILNLKVVRFDGYPIGFGIAVVRSLSSVFSTVVMALGFLWVIWDPEKQSWHDKIAGTVVVQLPSVRAIHPVQPTTTGPVPSSNISPNTAS